MVDRAVMCRFAKPRPGRKRRVGSIPSPSAIDIYWTAKIEYDYMGIAQW